MKTKLNLRACPYCGGKAEYIYGIVGRRVSCTRCYARTFPTNTREKAIANWNRRKSDRGLAKRIEHAVYDYVVRAYGKSAAFDPSLSIPDLARSVAKDLANPAYKPVNKLKYSWEDR